MFTTFVKGEYAVIPSDYSVNEKEQATYVLFVRLKVLYYYGRILGLKMSYFCDLTKCYLNPCCLQSFVKLLQKPF